MSYKPHRVGGTSPAKIRAVLCDPLATANTATIITRTMFGRGFKPNEAQVRCDGLGAGVASTLDIQVGGVTILTTPIVIGVVNTVYTTSTVNPFVSGTVIPNNTPVSFIFSNTSGGNMLGATASITGEVAHTA
jgi:hypothetical protein